MSSTAMRFLIAVSADIEACHTKQQVDEVVNKAVAGTIRYYIQFVNDAVRFYEYKTVLREIEQLCNRKLDKEGWS